MTTVAYVRVSTEDQVEFSPDAQAKRCRDLAKLKQLGAVTVLADEGWSGKSLDRPAMRDLVRLIEAGAVQHLLIWRWDRLSRDQGDVATLVKLFDRHHVAIHSVNEGDLDLASASGRMQVGVHGVFAQYYRDQLVENTKMGTRQAIESGRWTNRAPTGYTMVNKRLEPSEDAPLVQRVFALRASGLGYQRIADEVGWTYSVVQHILHNRVYLGETQLRGEWFRGLHPPLVNSEQFDAAQRGHVPGRRRSRELLSGKVRCGLCGRIAGVCYNDRNQVLYRCRHRGMGCAQPGRSASGLQRAARLGLSVLGDDLELQSAIRDQLAGEAPDEATRARSLLASINGLKSRQRKLLDLHYADQIDGPQFAAENVDLARQIASLETALRDSERACDVRLGTVAAFERVAQLLAAGDFSRLWDAATSTERRTLVDELVDSICIYPDQVTVQVIGAPPIKVMLDEVGLTAGSRTVVSEAVSHFIR